MNNLIINKIQKEGNIYILDGIYQHEDIYPFKFVGNQNENIINIKKLIIEYNLFNPISSKLEDCVLEEDLKNYIRENCIKYINKDICYSHKINSEKDTIYSSLMKDFLSIFEVGVEKKDNKIVVKINDSNFIDFISYDNNNNVMGIKYSNSFSLYLYCNLDYETFLSFVNCVHKGKELSKIKSLYKCVQITNLEKIKEYFSYNEEILDYFN